MNELTNYLINHGGVCRAAPGYVLSAKKCKRSNYINGLAILQYMKCNKKMQLIQIHVCLYSKGPGQKSDLPARPVTRVSRPKRFCSCLVIFSGN